MRSGFSGSDDSFVGISRQAYEFNAIKAANATMVQQ
jgi:hypothetical protein